MTKQSDESAFPWGGDIVGGMTLRDYAAIAAMQALVTGHITHFGHDNHWPPVDVAKYAGEIADAMLLERA